MQLCKFLADSDKDIQSQFVKSPIMKFIIDYFAFIEDNENYTDQFDDMLVKLLSFLDALLVNEINHKKAILSYDIF